MSFAVRKKDVAPFLQILLAPESAPSFEQRFIPKFLNASKFQDFLRFTKIFQTKLSLQSGCIYTKLLSKVVSKNGQ